MEMYHHHKHLSLNNEMYESASSRAKKAKRSALRNRLTAEKERAKQFPEDLYADGGIIFCFFGVAKIFCRQIYNYVLDTKHAQTSGTQQTRRPYKFSYNRRCYHKL